MSTRSPARTTQLALNLARTNPEFALRVSQRLTGEARQDFLKAALCPEPSVTTPRSDLSEFPVRPQQSPRTANPESSIAAQRPGLKKCGTPNQAPSVAAMPPISQALFGFARSVSRVAN
ncbi:MAG: hypothetical protein SFV15_05470 [Polyangiaceae bacterium]|nr:hypothetical protein [Polyangiaceae bacterium]